MLNDQLTIKNEVKKLIIVNLSRIFKQNIIFVGSLCDFLYTDLSIDAVKDIDIMIPYKYKDIFLNKLLFDDFYISKYNHTQKYVIQLYKAYLVNLQRQIQTFNNNFSLIFKYRYTLNIFGINLDIFLYTDNIIYSSNLWYQPNIDTINNEKDSTYNLGESLIENYDSRVHKLSISSSPKHKAKLAFYNNTNFNQAKIIEKLNSITEFKLPNDFLLENYKKYNSDLNKKFIYKDTYISHYIQYGILQNRKYI